MGTKRADWENLQRLFLAYRDGDTAAARPLFLELSSVLTGYYRARMSDFGSGGEDLVQATLLKVHFARDRFDESLSLKTWIFTIASRALIDHWRGRDPEELGGEEGETAAAAVPDTELAPDLRLSLRQQAEEALRDLKPTDRAIVYLFGVEELSMAEIAASLGISEGAVKVRAHRAYKAARKSVERT